MAAKKDDPLDKLRDVVKETVSEMFNERDRKEKEASDPWERLRGTIRDVVKETLSEREQEREEAEPKERKKADTKKSGGFMKVLGLEDEEAG